MARTSLEQQIVDLTEAFALQVFDALRAGSLDDLLALDRASQQRPAHVPPKLAGTRRRRGRGRTRKTEANAAPQSWGEWGPNKSTHKRIRRSPLQLEKLANLIVAIVKDHPKGVNAEAIKTRMGIKHGNVGAKVFTKPLGVALASKRIRKTGTRRGTTYFAA
jgi:hypothetical protein